VPQQRAGGELGDGTFAPACIRDLLREMLADRPVGFYQRNVHRLEGLGLSRMDDAEDFDELGRS